MKDKYDGSQREGKREGSRALGLFRGLATTVLLVLTSCGYTLNHRLKEGWSNPAGLYVPVFTNNTNEVGAERVFTDAFIREMQSRGQMMITSRRPGAYEVQGNITAITYAPTNMTPTNTVTPPYTNGLRSYRRLPTEIMVDAAIELRLVDPADGRVIWSGTFSNYRRVGAVLSRTYDYQSPSSLGIMQQSLIESQYAGIARDIMRDAYDAMVELF
jgi:hypothetical protein